MDLTGMVLKGRYCVLEQIGKGGNGKVYLARDMELGVLRAVKELPLSGKREARFLVTLEHHSLPKMVDYEENGEHCYIIMEYVKGENLGEALREGRTFTDKEVAEFGISLAQVLGYFHERKPPIFYGDLKPDNLMLSENGKLYLIDLGSAVTGYGRTQRVCTGTEGFAAPEQYEGEMGPASDVYSFGRTLKALLYKNGRGLLLRNPMLAVILLRCCLREEKLRYQNMEIVEKRLEKVQRQNAFQKFAVLGVAGILMLALLVAGVFFLRPEKELDFHDKLTRVTELYAGDSFRMGNPKGRALACQEAEAQLKELLRQYHGIREYRQVMKLLAYNSECAEDYEAAALYYEQMLENDGNNPEAYGDYGMFLLRVGQEDAARELWEDYLEKEKNGGLEEGKSWNQLRWEEAMKERVKEKTKKSKSKSSEKSKKEKSKKKEKNREKTKKEAERVFPKENEEE